MTVAYLSLGGVELVNSARTADTLTEVPGWGRTCCPVVGLPDNDPGWPDGFRGLVAAEVTGLDSATITRQIVDRAGDGSFLGSQRVNHREVYVRGILVADTCAGLADGMDWLKSTILDTGCVECDGRTLQWVQCCDPNTTRHLRGAKTIQAPLTLRTFGRCCGTSCGGNKAEIEFILASGDPHAYTDPEPVADLILDPCAAEDGCNNITWQTEDDPAASCFVDDACAPGLSFPPIFTPIDNCTACEAFTVARECVQLPESSTSGGQSLRWEFTTSEDAIENIVVRWFPDGLSGTSDEWTADQAVGGFGIGAIPPMSVMAIEHGRVTVTCPQPTGETITNLYTTPSFENPPTTTQTIRTNHVTQPTPEGANDHWVSQQVGGAFVSPPAINAGDSPPGYAGGSFTRQNTSGGNALTGGQYGNQSSAGGTIVPAVEGDVVQSGMWVKHDAPTNRNVRMYVSTYDASDTNMSNPHVETSVPPSVWTWIESGEETMPADTAKVSCATLGFLADTETIWFSGAYIAKNEPLPSGGFYGGTASDDTYTYTFTGAANDSPSVQQGESPDEWVSVSGSDEPVLSTALAHTGNQSLYVRRGDGTSGTYARDFLTGLLPAAGTYRISAQVWIPSTVDPAFDDGLQVQGPGTPTVLALDTDLRDQWVELTGTFEWDGANGIHLNALSNDQNAEMWIDDIIITEGADYVAYFDGDSQHGTWDGTQYQSTSTLDVHEPQSESGGNVVGLGSGAPRFEPACEAAWACVSMDCESTTDSLTVTLTRREREL